MDREFLRAISGIKKVGALMSGTSSVPKAREQKKKVSKKKKPRISVKKERSPVREPSPPPPQMDIVDEKMLPIGEMGHIRKSVVDFLRDKSEKVNAGEVEEYVKRRARQSSRELSQESYVWEAVSQSLRRNPSVTFDGGFYQYKGLLSGRVRDKTDILRWLGENTHGCNLDDFRDSYVGVMYDIDELVSSSRIFVVNGIQGERLFYRNPEYAIKPDPELQELWKSVKVPESSEKVSQLLDRLKVKRMNVIDDITPRLKEDTLQRKRRRRGRKINQGDLFRWHPDNP